jgi:hypothetical protein
LWHHSDDSIGVIYDRDIFIILAAGVWVDSYPCWQILNSDENAHFAAVSVTQRERERERERETFYKIEGCRSFGQKPFSLLTSGPNVIKLFKAVIYECL